MKKCVKKDWYYQVKSRKTEDDGCPGNWNWPPVHSGMVQAFDKKEAKRLVDEEYGRVFPQRVTKKNLEQHDYLLNIREVPPDDDRTRELFKYRACKQCDTRFAQIDLYNDPFERYKGNEFCSFQCKSEHDEQNRVFSFRAMDGVRNPVIYRIRNTKTGQSYIGKTTQPFTLRWYQHFFHGNGCKFHNAIHESAIEDWEFSVVERVVAPKGSLATEVERLLCFAENAWIEKLDTINNGYNTAGVAKKEAAPMNDHLTLTGSDTEET